MIEKVVHYFIWKMLCYIVPYASSEIKKFESGKKAVLQTLSALLTLSKRDTV